MTGTEFTHYSRFAYYAPYTKLKPWQRCSIAVFIMSSALAVGCFWDKQAEKRYSAYRGRTSLYGSSTTNPGWQNEDAQLSQ